MILHPGSVSAVCVYRRNTGRRMHTGRRKSMFLTAYLTQEVAYAPNHDP